MILNVLELLMLILYVLARVAGTIAIVWLLCTKLKGSITEVFLFALVAVTILVGLGFSIKYDNPNNHQALPPAEQRQP